MSIHCCCIPKAKQLEKEIYEPVSIQQQQLEIRQKLEPEDSIKSDVIQSEPRKSIQSEPRKSMQLQRQERQEHQEHSELSQKEIPKEPKDPKQQDKLPFMPLPIPIIIDPNFEERACKILESKNTPPEEIEKLKENLVGFRDAIEQMNTGELSYSEMRSRYG
jgi:hypothetical protein